MIKKLKYNYALLFQNTTTQHIKKNQKEFGNNSYSSTKSWGMFSIKFKKGFYIGNTCHFNLTVHFKIRSFLITWSLVKINVAIVK